MAKEKPILFSGEMVRAILADKKTQTRRVLVPQPPSWASSITYNAYEACWFQHGYEGGMRTGEYGKLKYDVGDVLYVRESWATDMGFENTKPSSLLIETTDPVPVSYNADDSIMWHTDEGLVPALSPDKHFPQEFAIGRTRPSIHMPKWMSRIKLRVNEVYAEPLQGISLEAILAEGVVATTYLGAALRGDWIHLWDSINKERGYGWQKNPWVAVYKFERVQ